MPLGGVERLVSAAGVAAAYLGLCAWTYGRHRYRRKREAGALAHLRSGKEAGATVLVAFASQTGTAERIAWQTAEALRGSDVPVRLSPLAGLDAAAIASHSRALFIISTTGEGDPPDNAAGFVRRVMGTAAPLAHLEYGVLALGDHSYRNYCAFGYAVDAWLRESGGRPAFGVVDVDDNAETALQRWRDCISGFGVSWKIATAGEPGRQRWKLAERYRLNPGSEENPAFHLRLERPREEMHWTAGDIAQIWPRNDLNEVERVRIALGLDTSAGELLADSELPADPAAMAVLRNLSAEELSAHWKPLKRREYSIASLPGGGLQLTVRQVRDAGGRLGLGSGWLTEHLPPGGELELRIRPNPGFHPPESDRPLILIGSGTGIAGLRAHLLHRIQQGHRRNWLLFGERYREWDGFYRIELEQWRRDGFLEHLDLVYSRDSQNRTYVQHRLRENGERLGEWVEQGAAIYVCGSRAGMGAAVGNVLADLLGQERLESLAAAGLYRRDVY